MADCSACKCGILKLFSGSNKITNGTSGKKVKVMVCGNGSRGDCQPLVALCVALDDLGFDCVMVSNPESEAIATGANIKFESNGNPFIDYFTSETGTSAFEKDDFMAYLMGLGGHNAKYMGVTYEKIYDIIQRHQPDLAITAVQHWQDKFIFPFLFRIPAIQVNLSNALMVNPDEAPFKMPSAPPGQNAPIWEAIYKAYLGGLTEGVLALERLTKTSRTEWFPTFEEYAGFVGNWPGYGDASSFMPEIFMMEKDGATPRDRPWFTFTGAAIMPEGKCRGELYGGRIQDDLEKFLAESPLPPIYFGWGSVTCGTPQSMTARAVRSLMILNRRGIILGGYSKLTLDSLDGLPDEDELRSFCKTNVLFMDTANHGDLFPRCAAIVHHGGVGTTNASVRAGVPTIITPIFYDQFESKDIVQNIGCGVGTDQLGKLSPEELAGEIKRCLEDEKMLLAAKVHRQKCLKENGAVKTASLISKIWDEHMKSPSGKYWHVVDKLRAEKRANNAKVEIDAKMDEDHSAEKAS